MMRQALYISPYALALAYFLAKEGTALGRDLVDRALRTPALIKERSGGGLRGKAVQLQPMKPTLKRLDL
jgi:hypothetical protein